MPGKRRAPSEEVHCHRDHGAKWQRVAEAFAVEMAANRSAGSSSAPYMAPPPGPEAGTTALGQTGGHRHPGDTALGQTGGALRPQDREVTQHPRDTALGQTGGAATPYTRFSLAPYSDTSNLPSHDWHGPIPRGGLTLGGSLCVEWQFTRNNPMTDLITEASIAFNRVDKMFASMWDTCDQSCSI